MRRDLGAGNYDSGDVISVFPDDHKLGACEDIDEWRARGRPESEFPGWFYIVDVDGLSVDDAQKYLESETSVDRDGNPVATRRRTWRVRVTELALAKRVPDLDSRMRVRCRADESAPFVLRKP